MLGAAGCGQTLLPVEDPSGSGNLVYRLDLRLPEKLDPVPMKTSPYGPGLRLYLAPVEDARDDRTRLGELTGGSPPVPILGSGMPPAIFVGQVFATELAEAGIVLVDREDAANRVLRLRLVRFFTEEHNMYHAEVRAIAEVLDADQKVIAAITAAGSWRLFGRSLSLDDYCEVFGQATMEMASNVLGNGRIQGALEVPANAVSQAAPDLPRTADGGAR